MSDSREKTPETHPHYDVPKAVVNRLSLYLRELQHLQHDSSGSTTNSTELGKRLGFSDAQVRKDLAYFGKLGLPGVGYRCDQLIEGIRKVLGTNRPWPVALVGVGNLGRALLGYRGFGQQGFRVVAAFDVRPDIIGQQIEGIPVYHQDELPRQVREKGIRLAVLAVPASNAQDAANRLVAAGIEGIMNFAPVTIAPSSPVSIQGVDLAIELEQLAYEVANRQESSSAEPNS